MLKGLWSLTWLEIKIFAREPLGLVGTVGVPVAIVMFLGRIVPPAHAHAHDVARRRRRRDRARCSWRCLIALNAVLSLVTIIAIYREGGILKRLRATPLRSHTILTAHVLAKLLFTGLTLLLTRARRRPNASRDHSMGACSGSWAHCSSPPSACSRLAFLSRASCRRRASLSPSAAWSSIPCSW